VSKVQNIRQDVLQELLIQIQVQMMLPIVSLVQMATIALEHLIQQFLVPVIQDIIALKKFLEFEVLQFQHNKLLQQEHFVFQHVLLLQIVLLARLTVSKANLLVQHV